MHISISKRPTLLIGFLFLLAVICKWSNQSGLFSAFTLIVFILYSITMHKKEVNYAIMDIKVNRSLFVAFLIALGGTCLMQLINGKFVFNYIMEILEFGLLLILGIVVFEEKNNKQVIKIFLNISFIIVICGLFGIFEFITKNNLFVALGLFDGEFLTNNNRIASVFIHPIVAGLCNVVALLIIIFFQQKNIYWWFSVLILGLNIVYSQSRSSWIGLIIIVILFTVRKIYQAHWVVKKNWIFIFAIIIPILIFGLWKSSLINIIAERFTEISNYDLSKYQRTATITYIFNSVRNSNIFNILLGHGNHATAQLMLSKTFEWQGFTTTDNLWLADLYNFGVIYMCLAIFNLIRFSKLIIVSHDRIVLCVASIVISLSAGFLFIEPFNYYPLMFLFFFSIGILQAAIAHCSN